MTEAEIEWLACEDPEGMWFDLLGPQFDPTCPEQLRQWRETYAKRSSDRKMRLFAVACCRRIWPLITDRRSQACVLAAEAYADGQGEVDDLERHLEQAEYFYRHRPVVHNFVAAEAASYTAELNAWTAANNASRRAAEALNVARNPHLIQDEDGNPLGSANFNPLVRFGIDGDTAEIAAQAAIIRDIFGNPFRPVAFSPEWRTDTAVLLARQMYENRDFSAMPILADALQDAGCDNEGILSHCRTPGPHVRGCWVVDLVLSKE